MNIMNSLPTIDGHNDTLLKLYLEERSSDRLFFNETSVGHIDLPRARKGMFSAGFFAIFCPNPKGPMLPDFEEYVTENGYDLPLASAVDYDYCHQMTNAMVAQLYRLQTESNGALKVVTNSEELDKLVHNDTLGAILHFEGDRKSVV